MSKKHYIVIAIVIVVLVGAYLFITKDKVAAPDKVNIDSNENYLVGEDMEDPNSAPASNQLPTTNSALAVSTQIAGSFVTIDNLFLEQSGFIVIHESDNSGAAGAIIGQSGLLKPGSGQDLEIKAKILANKTYIAMIHTDNGNGNFNASEDKPTLNSQSNPVMVQFQVGN